MQTVITKLKTKQIENKNKNNWTESKFGFYFEDQSHLN